MTDLYELGEYIYTETTICAPVPAVWPLFLDMNRWYTDYHWDWISGPPYDGVGLQERQVLKATPQYGAGLEDASLWYFQEQLKITKEAEIVVKLTASEPKSMSAEYGARLSSPICRRRFIAHGTNAWGIWQCLFARDEIAVCANCAQHLNVAPSFSAPSLRII